MRLRTLFAITLTMFAIPAFAVGQRDERKPEEKPISADALAAIAAVRLEAAFDEKTATANKEALLDLSRKGYEKALEQEPKNKAALRGMAQFHARLGEREKSVEMYKKYLTLYPKDAEVAHEVATAHARWKDWTGAVAWCEFTLKIDPESRSVKKTLGFCLASAGKWDEAFATLSQVMPEAQARHNLAGLLNHSGQADKAKEQLRLAVKADPNYAPASDYLRELESVAVMPAPRELPAPPASPTAVLPDLSVCFEVRTIKAPVGFCERVGLKLTGNTVLTDTDLRRILEAAQGQRDANVVQMPKVTALDGQEATVKNCDQRSFVTSLEVTKVKGQTVFVPKNTPIELGDTLTVSGRIARDAQTVTIRANLTRRFIAGEVPLVPVTTQITPVFEGGSQGQPIPFTQFLQTPDVKTEQVGKTVIISADHTIVLGGWKETGERPAKAKGLLKKEVPATEYEVVTFATVRVVRVEPATPMPRELPARVTKVFEVFDLVVPGKLPPGKNSTDEYSKNVDRLVKTVTEMVRPCSWIENGGRGTAEFFDLGCALVVTNTPDVVQEASDLLEALRRLKGDGDTPQAVPATVAHKYKLRNVAAADAVTAVNAFLTGQKLVARVTAEAEFNNVVVSAVPAVQKQIGDILTKLDEKPAPARWCQVVKLRNIAAADAAQAVNAYLTSKKLMNVVVVAEPVSNTVLVSAESAQFQQTIDLITALDKVPPQVLVQAMVMEVPRGSAITQWLADDSKPNATSWTLTPREVKSLTTLIREAKGRDEIDILSRPQLQVADNQTGFVQVGQSFPMVTAGAWKKTADGTVVHEPKTIEYMPTGCSMKLTPRVSPDGSVLLRTEAQYTWVLRDAVTLQSEGGETAIKVPAFNTQSVNSTTAVRDGETFVLAMQGGNAPTASSFFGAARQHFAGEVRVILVVLTPHIVRSEVENARVLAEEATKQPLPNAVDPCFPERYNYAARQAVTAPFAQQVANGHFLKQTVWNYHFEAGTDKLTPAGLEKLDSLARTRPAPGTKVYIQTARDLTAPVGKLADLRTDLDAKRAAAVQKYLAAQPAIGAAIAYEVYVHDAPVPVITETPASASQGAGGAVRPAGGSPK